MATAFTPMLYSVEWSSEIKITLIAVISAMLAGVVALLIMELVGKRNSASNLPAGDDRVWYGSAESSPEPLPEPTPLLAPAPAPSHEDSVPVGNEVEFAPSAELVDDDENADTGTVIVDGARLKVRYNRSFTARLIQSDDTLKGYYSILRNELLRYGLKSRVSWGNESMYRGKNTYAKFAVRGKTLSMYLALAPVDFANTKYVFRDAGSVEKYRDVPMQLKLRSDRAVRWALELIAAMADKNKLTRKNAPEENFRPDYRNTTSLVREKYIKLYYVSTPDVSEQALKEAAAADLRELDRTPREFTTKLMRADGVLKARYSAVKNELLRFGMKPRMSTSNESWYRGKVTYAKFAIRGKTLFLHMALDPDEFEGTKYNFRDMGDVGKYGTVPMRVKLKSDRSVRWVKELIATMAEKKGWTREELAERDFRYVKNRKK